MPRPTEAHTSQTYHDMYLKTQTPVMHTHINTHTHIPIHPGRVGSPPLNPPEPSYISQGRACSTDWRSDAATAATETIPEVEAEASSTF